jgi:uncharacterized DUF497 family protein
MTDFEWDKRKRAANLRKHGIDFVGARRVFDGPTIEFLDVRREYREERVIAFGDVDGVVLLVVYVWRNGRRRLISARKAGANERKAYFKAVAS